MIRVLELFGGYGSQALALENLGIEFESDLCEIDKYAIQAYNQLHGETFNYGDICTIDETKLPHYDLITYSSPCQDFSQAGKQAGGEKGSGTRSSLLWECERIIRANKPKYLLMENVKALTSKKFMPLFQQWLDTLESMGYQNWWKVLNAKDYGVPQNRERVFVVSILGGGEYKFPDPIPLTKKLKDVLEKNVDEKYYLSQEIANRFHQINIGENILGSTKGENNTQKGQKDVVYDIEKGIGALTATDYKQPKQILEPICCVPEATKQGYAIAKEGDSINLDQPNSKTRRGRVGHEMANTLTCSCNQGVVEPKIIQVGNIVHTGNFDNPQRGRIYSSDGCSPALSTMQGGGLEPKITENFRIRRLTPRECWRLMGVRDEQFDRIHGISNSQLYKMAGNSIVVDVLMAVFKNMLLQNDDELKELATKNDMLAMENEDLKDHCNALIGLVRSLDEEQLKENKGESKMKLGDTVKIEQLGAIGRIIAIVISEYGKRYEVRYFWEGRPEQTMFFEDELKEVENENSMVHR